MLEKSLPCHQLVTSRRLWLSILFPNGHYDNIWCNPTLMKH